MMSCFVSAIFLLLRTTTSSLFFFNFQPVSSLLLLSSKESATTSSMQSLLLKTKPFKIQSISRSKFMRTPLLLSSCCFCSCLFMMSSSASSSSPSSDMQSAISLLDSVYGSVNDSKFPLPMPSEEAGLCADGKQRRYLWTDAFGVLAYTSIADRFEKMEGKTDEATKYRQACKKLIDTVHNCLGKPRSSKADDAMQLDKSSPTGYVGLRIGKVDSKKITDYGMRYDGQYWHYVDKWLLALGRAGYVEDGIQIAKSIFPYFFDAGPHGDGRDGGIRWKLSVDSTPPISLQFASASDDTLVALIVFKILEESSRRNNGNNRSGVNLINEIKLLENSLEHYRPRVTDDPLGWGLESIFDQYIVGNPRQHSLTRLANSALHPSHMSLPFRLYGAMIGARINNSKLGISKSKIDKLIHMSLDYETKAIKGDFVEDHSSINRVMLAMCLLCPGGALDRKSTDPLINL